MDNDTLNHRRDDDDDDDTDDDDDDGNDLSDDCGAEHYCQGGSVYGICLYTAGHKGPHYCSTCASNF